MAQARLKISSATRKNRPRHAKTIAAAEINKYFRAEKSLQGEPTTACTAKPIDHTTIPSKMDENNNTAVDVKMTSASRSIVVNTKVPANDAQQHSSDSPPAKTKTIVNTENASKRKQPNGTYDYNFDALHTDDESDTEDNTPYAPEWSKFYIRKPQVIGQVRINAKVVDDFFGCRHELVDGKALFPHSGPIKRRRSSAWDTPPLATY